VVAAATADDVQTSRDIGSGLTGQDPADCVRELLPRGILNAKAECTGLHGPAKVACPNVVRMGDWQPGHLLHRSRRETVETRHLDVQDCDVGTVRPSGRVVAGIRLVSDRRRRICVPAVPSAVGGSR
jgi:hypothetical protein